MARNPFLEIACFDGESAIHAAEGGADRIELCQDYYSGGLSADASTLAMLKSRISIPVFVMIRPHSRNFFYDDLEFDDMKSTLKHLKDLGADGFVFGILQDHDEVHRSSWIDIERNTELVKIADGRPCTFHRAFDCIPQSDWDATLADLIKCGFRAVLTSGGPSGNNAVDCVNELADLTNHDLTGVGSYNLEIIIGGGVRSSNIVGLWKQTSAQKFHSSALVNGQNIVSLDEVALMKHNLQKCALLDCEGN